MFVFICSRDFNNAGVQVPLHFFFFSTQFPPQKQQEYLGDPEIYSVNQC